jgi:5-methylcytosine-specific restriction endonuclease McrA
MQNLKCHADRRNKGFCVHCGGPDETDDHVPSKVLLDEPYPENLMVCPRRMSQP